MTRQVLSFACGDDMLPGIVEGADASSRTGVLIVVGGPQYRVGSHRQFVLLARHLATRGIPAMRFDYRGMGDAEGRGQDFEAAGPDIAAAADAFMQACPQLTRIVLWGLCDGASAALFHAARDARVCGVVLLNPWVRTAAGQSQALVSHYYLRRLLSADFWRKLLRGGLRVGHSLREFAGHLGAARGMHGDRGTGHGGDDGPDAAAPLPARMAWALRCFGGDALVILSGQDLVAAEYRVACIRPPLADALATCNVHTADVVDANHTFSTARWRDQVADLTAEFVAAMDGVSRS